MIFCHYRMEYSKGMLGM